MRVSVTSVGGKEKKWRKKKNKRAKEKPERASESQVDGGREINFND
jgi:hypothetical protein